MAEKTADLLVEIICEDIPARMQAGAAKDLARMFAEAFAAVNLAYDQMHSFVAPQHLALYVDRLMVQQNDSVIEKRGPRVDAPEQAINGFLKSTGLTYDQVVAEETLRGTFLFARTEMKGTATATLLPLMISNILANFPWPKSQRWGNTSFRWVRPLHRVNVLFDGSALDGAVDLGGAKLAFTSASRGHYFEAPRDLDLIGIGSADEYVDLLRGAHVIVDQSTRINMIRRGATELAASFGCELKTSELKIAEIAGLVEHPHLLVGAIEDRFMSLPAEVLQSSIETHQKYITLQAFDGSFSSRFIVVSNRLVDDERDGVILAGNQRVLSARLADAEFFWLEDGRTLLANWLPRLATVAFYEGLGTVHDKALRLEKLAADIAQLIPGADKTIAARAGLLAKADLVTGMVSEFPELQGIMGGYYAVSGGEKVATAAAIASHYRPQGPGVGLPDTAEGLAVALADKIDTLVGFFGVGARPNGSKDPFALRRAALGVIRILTEAEISLPLPKILQKAAGYNGFATIDDELLPFIRERVRVGLRDAGIAHDVVAAALGDGELEDICLLADRAVTLGAFLDSEDGAGLMAGWRRAASILKSEEAKDKQVFVPETNPGLFVKPAETELHAALEALPATSRNVDLSAALTCLGSMRAPIDHFFDEVVVNDDNPSVRRNRLGLLAMVRERMLGVANFSKLEG